MTMVLLWLDLQRKLAERRICGRRRNCAIPWLGLMTQHRTLNLLEGPRQHSGHISKRSIRDRTKRHAFAGFLVILTFDVSILEKEGMIFDVIRPDNVVDIARWIYPEAFNRDIASTSFTPLLRSRIANRHLAGISDCGRSRLTRSSRTTEHLADPTHSSSPSHTTRSHQ